MEDRDARAKHLKDTMVDHVGVSVWLASNSYVAEMYRRAAAEGFDDMSIADGTIMGYLPFEGISIAGLAARRGATKQATHEAVQRLVKRGVLDLLPDPKDRRAKRVVHSERGLAFEAALQQIKRDMQREAEAAIGTEALAEMERNLDALRALFQRS